MSTFADVGIAVGVLWAAFWVVVAIVSHRSDLKQVERRMRL